MVLDEYLRTAPRGEAARLSRRIGITQMRLCDYRYGRRVPSVELAARISLATSGIVKPEDLVPEINWRELRKALRCAVRSRE